MRIAFFTDSYLPAKDGVVTSIISTKTQLEKEGHEVFLFAPDPWEERDRQKGVYYFRAVNFKSYPGYTVPMFPTNKCEILKKLDIDVIHTHGVLFMGLRSLWAARTLGKPVVLTFHTMITDAAKYYARFRVPDWLTNRLLWIYMKELLERSDAVVAPTIAIKTALLDYAPDMKMVEVIPTGVDCTRFNPSNHGTDVLERYGLNGNKVILHVGRLAREKNLDLVLTGFSKMNDLGDRSRLVIVGEGPAKKYYADLAKELGIAERTIFTGFVPDIELPKFYAACDAFVIASKFETQGLVLLEAMASGRSVAGINYRAVAEIIKNGENGFLFEDDPMSCAEAMENALSANEELGKRARACAERYSVVESTNRLVKLYGDVIKNKKGKL